MSSTTIIDSAPFSNAWARRQPIRIALAAFVLLALVAAASLWAQVAGDRGIAPVASSTDIEVRGIEVNASGDNAEDARANGWRQAQRVAWKQIGGPDLPDSRLDSLVAAIVVEEENIGPRRYVARLGVIFDRQRAGGLLGGDGRRSRSAPMLLLPVTISGGAATMFEVRNPWQRAWAEYQFGSSAIDYIRPSGAGGESLLLTYGQTGRRSRSWWNTILDQFSAADVLVPIAKLQREWPGGPVIGHFTARYGPDNRYLGEFTMRADSDAQLPSMLVKAVERFDVIFARALADGTLRPDPTLTLDNIEITPEVRALLEEAQAADAADLASQQAQNEDGAGLVADPNTPETPPPAAAAAPVAYVVQVQTPDAAAFDAALSGVRAVPGVSGSAVTSTAIGGTSVLRVTFTGSLADLAAGLRARGWQVVEGSNALAISR